MNVQYVCNFQEEADTNIIVHSLDTIQRVTAMSVLVPHPTLTCLSFHFTVNTNGVETYFYTGVRCRKRYILLVQVVHAFGITKIAALVVPCFYWSLPIAGFLAKGIRHVGRLFAGIYPAEVISASALGASNEVRAKTKIPFRY